MAICPSAQYERSDFLLFIVPVLCEIEEKPIHLCPFKCSMTEADGCPPEEMAVSMDRYDLTAGPAWGLYRGRLRCLGEDNNDT